MAATPVHEAIIWHFVVPNMTLVWSLCLRQRLTTLRSDFPTRPPYLYLDLLCPRGVGLTIGALCQTVRYVATSRPLGRLNTGSCGPWLFVASRFRARSGLPLFNRSSTPYLSWGVCRADALQ